MWNWAFGHDRSIGFGLEYLGHATLKFPRLVAAFVVFVTVFCIVQLPRISVDGDMLRVFAHSGQEYDDYEDLSRPSARSRTTSTSSSPRKTSLTPRS